MPGLETDANRFFLVPKPQLGNALAGEAPASRDRRRPEAGASGADAFPSRGLGTREGCELMTDKARAHVVVSGKVQGVFFRAETKKTAARYGVFGWVKNNSDGTVEAIFEGDEDDVKAVTEWCRQGPPHSRVKDVTVIYEDYSGKFKGFDITY